MKRAKTPISHGKVQRSIVLGKLHTTEIATHLYLSTETQHRAYRQTVLTMKNETKPKRKCVCRVILCEFSVDSLLLPRKAHTEHADISGLGSTHESSTLTATTTVIEKVRKALELKHLKTPPHKRKEPARDLLCFPDFRKALSKIF